jgi:hypothetical protein
MGVDRRPIKGRLRRAVHDAIIPHVRERFHSRRARTFLSIMKPWPGCSILDLGGADGEFLARIQSTGLPAKYAVADIATADAEIVRGRGFTFVELEEGAGLPFEKGEFDIVLCNSVIEHVTMPKALCTAVTSEAEWRAESWKRQMGFADEIRRVSNRYFVETPHRNFPIEQHTALPGVNWLSHAHTVSLLRWTDRFWIRPGIFVDWNLLGTREMRKLFPEAKMRVEHAAGLPKSIICYVNT